MKQQIVVCSMGLLLHVCGRADLLLVETFNYADGPIVGAAGSPWLTHSGTAGQANAVGGQLELTAAETEDINAPFDAGGASVFYAGFTLRLAQVPTGAGGYFAHFKGSGTTFRGRLFAVPSGVGSSFRLAVANASSAAADGGAMTPDLQLDTAYRLVLRYDAAAAVTTLWIDPATEADAGFTALDTASPAAVPAFAFRQAGGIGRALIDDLIVATTFDEARGGAAPPVVISVTATDAEAAEAGTDPGQFTLHRTGDLSAELVVQLAVGGTASATADYAALPDNVVFPAGQNSVTLAVIPVDDAESERAETVTLRVLPGDGYWPGTPNTATVTIADDDAAPEPTRVNLAIVDSEASENGPVPARITVRRTGPTDAPLLVRFEVSGSAQAGADFVPLGDAVTIPAGVESVDLIVMPIDDDVREGNELVVVRLLSDAAYEIGEPNLVVVTLLDDDQPPAGLLLEETFGYADGPIVGAPASPWRRHSGTEGQADVVAGELFLTQAESEDIHAPLAGGPFGTSSSVTLYASLTVRWVELPAGQGSYFAHFKDATSTGFRGRLFASALRAAPGGFRLGVANGAGTVDAAGELPVDLALETTYRVVVRYQTDTASTTLWLAPGAETDAGVTALDQARALAVEAFGFRQALSSGDGMGSVYVDELKVGTSFAQVVGDAPAQPVVTLRAVATAVSEGGTPAQWVVSRVGKTDGVLTVNLAFGGSATAGVDYQTPPPSVTIPAGEAEATLTLAVVDDEAFEGEETITVSLVPDPSYSLGLARAATVNLRDSDVTTPPMLSPPPPAANGEFQFLLTGQPGATYTVESSLDLSTWTHVRTFTLEDTSVLVSEPLSAEPGGRFYRARVGP